MHIHQIFCTSLGTRIAPPYANLFMGKQEGTIILTFLHLIYFWKHLFDGIFLGSHSWLKSLTTFVNTISPTIKNTFTYSEQTVSLLDVQNSGSTKLKTKLYKKPTHSLTVLHIHSYHPLSSKEGIIYYQALRYNMIISEDLFLLEELNNVTHIVLACAYPQHLIIENIKKALTHNSNYQLSQRASQSKPTIVSPLSPHCKSFLRHW